MFVRPAAIWCSDEVISNSGRPQCIGGLQSAISIRWKRYEVTGYGIALGNLAIHPWFGTSIMKVSELGESLLSIYGAKTKMNDSGWGNHTVNIGIKLENYESNRTNLVWWASRARARETVYGTSQTFDLVWGGCRGHWRRWFPTKTRTVVAVQCPCGGVYCHLPKSRKILLHYCALSPLTRICLRETCGGVGMTHREFDGNTMKVYLGLIICGSLLVMNLYPKGTAT